MRHKLVLPIALFVVSIVPAAQARTGRWRDVMRLPSGTPISVQPTNAQRVTCLFLNATKTRLFCQIIVQAPFPYIIRTDRAYRLEFDRRIVREVRLEHSDATNSLIGVGIGAGVGAALGAAGGNQTAAERKGSAVIFGMFGALIGGVIGKNFPLFHRNVIFKR